MSPEEAVSRVEAMLKRRKFAVWSKASRASLATEVTMDVAGALSGFAHRVSCPDHVPLGVVGVVERLLTAERTCAVCGGRGWVRPLTLDPEDCVTCDGSGRVPLVSVEEREAIICLLCEQVGWYDAAEGELIADDELHPNIPWTLGDAVARAVFVMAEGSMNE